MTMAVQKVAPAIAAGCAVVLKHIYVNLSE